MMQDTLAAIHSQETPCLQVEGLRGSAPALLAARTASITGRPVFCVVPSENDAANLEQDLNLFSEMPVYLYPGYEIPPYTPLSPDPVTVAARLATLYNVINTSGPFIFISSAEALLRRVLPKEQISSLTELVIQNEEANPDQLCERLINGGYEHVALVQTVGEFSVRGGIIDIFSPASDYPVRLDFFGDTVESIRYFDPITQRSIEELNEIVLLPARDILYPTKQVQQSTDTALAFRTLANKENWNKDDVSRITERLNQRNTFPGIEFFIPLFYRNPVAPFDYLPENALTVVVEPLEVVKSIQLTWERIEANYQEAVDLQKPAFPPATLFLSETELTSSLNRKQSILISDFDLQASRFFPSNNAQAIFQKHTVTSNDHMLLQQHIGLHRKKSGLLQPLTEKISEWMSQGEIICFGCHSEKHARHMKELLSQHGLSATFRKAPLLQSHLEPEKVLLYDVSINRGFDLAYEKLHFLSESELFGEQRLGRLKRKKKREAASGLRFEELRNGEIVVHRAHGLGVYNGLTHLTVNNIANDFIEIIYQGDDKLFVPIDQIGAISKYKGLTDKKPALDKLGSKSWAATKNKVQQAVWKVAQDLLDLYARRQLAQGKNFTKPDELYYELEESFPFDETPGQLQAINDVIADLTSEQPMDRLVCGDVGYGKTEVAVRAAFKVVLDGFQVAVLVPTTVLAEQHAETFRDRLKGFPIRIESLNRFRSTTSQKKIISELSAGKIDIIIGTHRLLSKDVVFKKLGLLIIDEEHRFGVTHKEKLKKLRTNVDVLTLTATPIPRTLQMSLLGIRDLSVISSPPEHRRSVKTFIARYDDLVIKEAITRELQRGGQVFVVHNRVQSIQDMAFKVQKAAPAARVAVAHGQMPPKKLEEIMVHFVNREVDVLVCTTIIESGLDIPNANTIVITRADRLGLAEIYQLRGRVGRSREQAYAYLLVPSLDGLSKDAKQRLRALMDYNDLGGGFKLAMSDLQIRGGGNILGGSQSGHIAAVGYDLYLDLLQKTVTDLKRKDVTDFTTVEEIDPEINLRLSAYIPESYVEDNNQRYIAYRKITGIANDEEILDLKDEFVDRYGTLPVEIDNLFEIISLKLELRALKIVKLEQGMDTLVFTFLDQTPVSPEKILDLVNRSKNKIRFTPEAKLIVNVKKINSPREILTEIRKVLHAIM